MYVISACMWAWASACVRRSGACASVRQPRVYVWNASFLSNVDYYFVKLHRWREFCIALIIPTRFWRDNEPLRQHSTCFRVLHVRGLSQQLAPSCMLAKAFFSRTLQADKTNCSGTWEFCIFPACTTFPSESRMFLVHSPSFVFTEFLFSSKIFAVTISRHRYTFANEGMKGWSHAVLVKRLHCGDVDSSVGNSQCRRREAVSGYYRDLPFFADFFTGTDTGWAEMNMSLSSIHM